MNHTPATFWIEKITPSALPAHVDVYVRYDGGAEVLTFPDNYPRNTLLSHVRTEIKARMVQADAKARLASLVGKHDL